MRIALAQTNPLIADLTGIEADIRARVAAAAAQDAELVVFPELAAIGYPPRDLLRRLPLVRRQWELVEYLARELPLPTVLGCVELLHPERRAPNLANAAALLEGGEVRAVYRKRLLPTYDVFDEQRYFLPGDAPLVVEVAGRRVALTVCEDIWNQADSALPYELDPVAELAGACDLVVNCSASPYCFRRPEQRLRLLAGVAARVGAPVCYVNQVGGNDELLFDGGSCLVGPDGAPRALAARWREDLVVADTEAVEPVAAPADDLADLARGIELGVADYCRKTGQARLVLGLSGGIDSAVVAVLAARALGADRVTGLLMPGPYSSRGSVDDARDLAVNLGIAHHVCPIVEANAAMLRALDEPFRDTDPNVAEENLQSRLRGALVMAYANRFGAMALTTGNKSEAAVGYCTLYGDTNGGLGPIGDLYKTTVYELAHEINRDGAPIPAATLDKPPSAELAPDQRDTDSLPPYNQLDRILMPFIERHAGAEEIIAAGEDPATVRRILRLVEISEYKRRQTPPILRVSPKAFGSGRRIPLARRIDQGLMAEG